MLWVYCIAIFIYLFILFLFLTRLKAPSGQGQLPYCLHFRFSEILGQLNELVSKRSMWEYFFQSTKWRSQQPPPYGGVKGTWLTPSAQTTINVVHCRFPLLLAHPSSKNADPYVSRASQKLIPKATAQ